MESNFKYRSFVYTEFNPRDFEQHFIAENKRPTPEDKPFATWEEWMVAHQQKAIGFNFFGPGEFGKVMISKVPGNEHGIYSFKGYYYFDSIDFTDEQKENQKKMGAGPLEGGVWYELVPEMEAGNNVR